MKEGVDNHLDILICLFCIVRRVDYLSMFIDTHKV